MGINSASCTIFNFLSRLLFVLWEGIRVWGGGWGVALESCYSPLFQLWVWSHQYHWKSSFLDLFSMGPWIMDFLMVSGNNMDQGHSHGLNLQYMPGTCDFFLGLVQTTKINMVICPSKYCRQNHGLWEGPQKPIWWTVVALQSIDINMASGGSTDHRHEHVTILCKGECSEQIILYPIL